MIDDFASKHLNRMTYLVEWLWKKYLNPNQTIQNVHFKIIHSYFLYTLESKKNLKVVKLQSCKSCELWLIQLGDSSQQRFILMNHQSNRIDCKNTETLSLKYKVVNFYAFLNVVVIVVIVISYENVTHNGNIRQCRKRNQRLMHSTDESSVR